MAEQKTNPVVAIAGVIGGISIAIVAIIAVLAKDQLPVAPWVIAPLAGMGIVLGYFASKTSKPE